MKTNIEKVFTVEEKIDRVWEYLSDPTKIVNCVPGASLTEKVDDRNYKGEVTTKFGPIKAKYNGEIHFETLDQASKTMKLIGKGLDAKGKGSADMEMSGQLTEVGGEGGTEVALNMEISIQGTLAQFGARLIKDVSEQLLNKFVTNFKDTLAGKEVDNSMNASSMVGGIVKGMFGKKGDENA